VTTTSTKQTIEVDDTLTVSGLDAPRGWICEQRNRDEDGVVHFRVWRRTTGEAISVVESIYNRPDDNGRLWLHVSVSKPGGKKVPTWDDLQTLRRLFVGEDRECYLIFPPKDRYVNLHNVLHLYCCLDAPRGVLPQMEGEVIPGVKSI
jgi:hypothetical protein